MFTYTFFGKVLPERTFVTLGPIPKMKIQTILPDGNMDYEAQVVIDTAQIMVVAHSPISIAIWRPCGIALRKLFVAL